MEKYGRLEILEKYHKFYSGKNRIMAYCKCDCGNFIECSVDSLKCGNQKSCGCIRKINNKIENEFQELSDKSMLSGYVKNSYINGKQILNGDINRFWEKIDIKEKDNCWYWLAGTGNKIHGKFNIDREIFVASRVALAVSGIIVEKEDNVLHSRQCTYNAENYFGNGSYSALCCNPKHLRIGTTKENADDTVATGRARGLFDGSQTKFGEESPFHKLSNNDVIQIRNDDRTHAKIGKEYGVVQSTISRIKNFKRRQEG